MPMRKTDWADSHSARRARSSRRSRVRVASMFPATAENILWKFT